jgi:ABC-2 type transport system permease protein
MYNFAERNRKEIFRDPLSIALGIALPLLLLLLFTTIEKNAPIDVFKVENLTPGLIVFSFAFLTMFSAILIAKDKDSAFLMRLLASPTSTTSYVLGYALPLLPLGLLQIISCYVASMALGLSMTISTIFVSILTLLPMMVISIFLGLCLGALFTEKQISGIGTIYITFVTFLGGSWLDLQLLGETMKTIAYLLPFANAIQLTRDVLINDFSTFHSYFWWSVGYMIVTLGLTILAFMRICKR